MGKSSDIKMTRKNILLITPHLFYCESALDFLEKKLPLQFSIASRNVKEAMAALEGSDSYSGAFVSDLHIPFGGYKMPEGFRYLDGPVTKGGLLVLKRVVEKGLPAVVVASKFPEGTLDSARSIVGEDRVAEMPISLINLITVCKTAYDLQ